MEASSVNSPHPDAQPDDAEDFFGTGGETPPQDPGNFDPESGSFKEPTETRTVEERAEDAYQYAKSHGEPITEGMEAKHQAFLAARGETPKAEEGEPSSEEVPEPLQQQARLRAIEERQKAEAADAPEPEVAAAVSEPAAEAQPQGDVGDGAPEPGTAPDSPEAGKKSGDLTREYIVFHRVPLSIKVLEHLLKQLQDGETAGEPQIAWIEVTRADARNVNGAVTAAYTSHQQQLGTKADLAAVSARAFQVKHVEPKQVVETNLSIT